MTQAKGVLPRGEDKDVLYKNPKTCGYFVSVKLDPAIDRGRAQAWFGEVGKLVDELVERLPATRGQTKGDKVAAVAVGLGPSFFIVNGQPRFDPPLEPPAAFAIEAAESMPSSGTILAGIAGVEGDVFFYVASVFEARVNAFISALAAMKPNVASVTFDRGYQRIDGTEPFGYADGLRNIRKEDRPDFVFVDQERQLEEPDWAHGGTYMAFLKIQQHPDAFAALPDEQTRDAIIGRTKEGDRLDLVGQKIDPKEELSEPPPNLPAASHVMKVGPRGKHDDTQIFRRGLPFVETSTDGQPHIGLNFCSFQASLDQFDVVFNDWAMNGRFPVDAAGPDALLDQGRQPQPLATIEKVGFFFVPPYHQEGLAAAVFPAAPKPEKPKHGRLVVRKSVRSNADPTQRFERAGFVFQVLNAQSQPVGGQFTSDSTGRAVCPEKLEVGQSYVLQEVSSPFGDRVQLQTVPFTMEKSRQQITLRNLVSPTGPYGG